MISVLAKMGRHRWQPRCSTVKATFMALQGAAVSTEEASYSNFPHLPMEPGLKRSFTAFLLPRDPARRLGSLRTAMGTSTALPRVVVQLIRGPCTNCLQ